MAAHEDKLDGTSIIVKKCERKHRSGWATSDKILKYAKMKQKLLLLAMHLLLLASCYYYEAIVRERARPC